MLFRSLLCVRFYLHFVGSFCFVVLKVCPWVADWEQVLSGLWRVELWRGPIRAVHPQWQELQSSSRTSLHSLIFPLLPHTILLHLYHFSNSTVSSPPPPGVHGQDGPWQAGPDDSVPPHWSPEERIQTPCSPGLSWGGEADRLFFCLSVSVSCVYLIAIQTWASLKIVRQPKQRAQ